MQYDIVIPCAGDARYVSETIKSALSQTMPASKIYLVDNGCEHGNYNYQASLFQGEIVSYLRFDSRLSMTRNWQRCLGVGNSGCYLMLHDDDILEPDAVEIAALRLTEDAGNTACLMCHIAFDEASDTKSIENRTAAKKAFLEGLLLQSHNVRDTVLGTVNAGHMSALFCKRGSLGFPYYRLWMPDQGFLANHLAFGKVAIAPTAKVRIREHTNSVTNSFRGSKRHSIETIEHIRNFLLYMIQERNLIPDEFGEIAGTLDPEYLLRLLQVCFSFPPRKDLRDFGKCLLKLPSFRNQLQQSTSFRKLLTPSLWTLASMAADTIYAFNEKKHPNFGRSTKAQRGK